MPQLLVIAAVVFVLAVLSELLRLNALLYRELDADQSLPPAQGRPPLLRVSVIIPAKDEADSLDDTIRSILNSQDVNIELILVDDRSVDKTLAIMEQWAQRDSRVHVIRNTELPAGWTGKTHAMRMGTQAATGEILLFSDADATFTPDGLERALTYFVDNDLDMLSLIPGFEERSFNEDAVYLHLALGFASCLPMSKVNDPADPAGIASGCFIMISMDAYERIGTWERFRTEITEDVAMSRALKAAGMRMRVLRGADLVRTKPFTSVREVARFWTRTLYGGLEKNLHKVLMLAGNYLALTIVFALFAWSAIQWWGGHASFWELLLFLTSGVASVAVIVPTMVLIRRERSHWILNGIVSPIGIVVSMGIALQAAYAIVTGKGIAWRGSLYK